METMEEREKRMTALVRSCAYHSWNARDQHGHLKHRAEFQALGIKSPEELSTALQKATRSQDAMSFVREPDPKMGRKEQSLIVQCKIPDQQGNKHDVTVILNPDLDKKTGKVHGGTSYVNEQTKHWELLKREWKQGRDPEISRREHQLSLKTYEAKQTPASRLLNQVPSKERPTLEREKQVTPVQEREQQTRKVRTHTTTLERLQQAKPDISKEIGERRRQREVGRDHELGR